MTKDEIAKKAEELKNEISAVSVPLGMTGALATFKQVRRVMNDIVVLIRELAETK